MIWNEKALHPRTKKRHAKILNQHFSHLTGTLMQRTNRGTVEKRNKFRINNIRSIMHCTNPVQFAALELVNFWLRSKWGVFFSNSYKKTTFTFSPIIPFNVGYLHKFNGSRKNVCAKQQEWKFVFFFSNSSWAYTNKMDNQRDNGRQRSRQNSMLHFGVICWLSKAENYYY